MKFKIETLRAELKKIIRNLNDRPVKHGNSKTGKIVWNQFDFFIPRENSNFVKSPYFYKGKKLVHFTNIYALNSILQEKHLRLYNLNKLTDPREFTFTSKRFNHGKSLNQDAKNNLFIMSFCDQQILKELSNEFNMWRLYGQNGKGIAIVFSIKNDSVHWLDFHLSEVIYGTKERQRFFKILSS